MRGDKGLWHLTGGGGGGPGASRVLALLPTQPLAVQELKHHSKLAQAISSSHRPPSLPASLFFLSFSWNKIICGEVAPSHREAAITGRVAGLATRPGRMEAPSGHQARLFLGPLRACLQTEAPRWKTTMEAEAKEGSDPGDH